MKKLSKVEIGIIALLLMLISNAYAQPLSGEEWSQEVISDMSLDEKIGQLFMIRAHSDLGKDHIDQIENSIKKFHVGGLCFFQGSPEKQIELINNYQGLSKIPMLISMDAEWGLGMRMKSSTISFPKQLTLGAIDDNTLIYEMGKIIASQLKEVGAFVNFAPVVDVNNNPSNPVIHNRSFGEDMFNVATKSYAYMKGMQDEGVMACAKHFPGHGDTDVDSHKDLPVLLHDRSRLDSLELMPFRVMSHLGVMGMMSAHLSVPSIDSGVNRPMSLSKNAIEGILRNELHFEGLVITDALEMQGVAKHFKPGEMEVEALLAGNDILLLPIDLEKAFTAIKRAVKSGRISEKEIDEKLFRILSTKHTLGLTLRSYIPNGSEVGDKLNNNTAKAFKTKLYENAVTLVKDERKSIPIKNIDSNKIASLSIGVNQESYFQKMLGKFNIEKNVSINKEFTSGDAAGIIKQLKDFEKVIISIHDMNIYKGRDFGITKATFDLIYKLNSSKEIILVLFGSPYSLQYFSEIPGIIMAYEEDELMQYAAAQALVGVNKIHGKLPVTAGKGFPIKTGIDRTGLFRLGYGMPEEVFVSSERLLKIDTIVQEMLEEQATPGCQILAARDGKIFFQKAYGYHTFDGVRKVENDDVFDVASVTKILATTISLMKLYDDDKIGLYEPIKKFLPQLDTTNKGGLILEDVLAHQAGLPSWIPFYESTLNTDSNSVMRIEEYFQEIKSDSFPFQICNNLCLRADWRDSIYNKIYCCELNDSREYKYSDLGFYLLHQIINGVSGKPLEEYVHDNFYGPLGLMNTMFNPTEKIDKNRIPPTEEDNYFRGQVVQGYVHDMGAAMLGGISGHAGLFSSSKDLAILMQMLLNGGSYGGTNYLKPKTVSKFTQRYYKSTRRGLGFDMKELDASNQINIADEASVNTFGHLGFTGISVFADPEHDLIYVFLSNRTYPTMKNNKIGINNYRPRIQSVFYNAIVKPKL